MKRKSNFDVPPEAAGGNAHAQLAAAAAAAAAVAATAGGAPPSNEALARIIASFGIANQSDSVPVITSVHPPAFKLRLQRAMDKNMRYIERLDSGAAPAKSQHASVPKQQRAAANQSITRPGLIFSMPYPFNIAL
jgi:hypothetical protein